jgi:hypothetical protein
MNFADVAAIAAQGFAGFQSVAVLQQTLCATVPDERGVYLFLRLATDLPVFLAHSIGGRFKGKGPTVPVATLRTRWVVDTPVVYIGKAGSLTGDATLRSRLRQYLEFGLGKPVGHWGGRYIWQLADVGNLQVCWKPTPGADPAAVETDLIRQFKAIYGRRPFANLRG